MAAEVGKREEPEEIEHQAPVTAAVDSRAVHDPRIEQADFTRLEPAAVSTIHVGNYTRPDDGWKRPSAGDNAKPRGRRKRGCSSPAVSNEVAIANQTVRP